MATRTATVAAACARIGCSADEYEARVASGEAWCPGCGWRPRAAFATDRERSTGRQSRCRECRREMRQRAA